MIGLFFVNTCPKDEYERGMVKNRSTSFKILYIVLQEIIPVYPAGDCCYSDSTKACKSKGSSEHWQKAQ